MSSYVSNRVHFVWSTDDRREWIDVDWQDDLYAYLGGVMRNKRARLVKAGGMPDHMHVYVALPATVSIAEMANAMKSNTSRWIRQQHVPEFRWQKGYGAFTVSKSSESNVIQYIENQPTHHKKRRFQDEFVALLKTHGIDYDDRYLWV